MTNTAHFCNAISKFDKGIPEEFRIVKRFGCKRTVNEL